MTAALTEARPFHKWLEEHRSGDASQEWADRRHRPNPRRRRMTDPFDPPRPSGCAAILVVLAVFWGTIALLAVKLAQ